MWVHRPSFFLFKTDTPGGKKYGFLQALPGLSRGIKTPFLCLDRQGKGVFAFPARQKVNK
jgi:hypothetical protein